MKFTETDYRGINYGPLSNFDPEMNIRYGVIHANTVGQRWYEESEPYYGEPCCPDCGAPAVEHHDPAYPDEMECTVCICTFSAENAYPEEPIQYDYCDDEYSIVQVTWGDLFVIKSPFFTYAQYCSPCAPGACNLESPLKAEAISEDNKCYCLGHDWFEDDEAPYVVYDCKTGQPVQPEPNNT